ncbi:MAG: hypothetical protein VKP62_00160 [Candidatus Sericytochromatia bacterium]|nr:hypothetical protein [Candidatus Sericytochromatia bacterium]
MNARASHIVTAGFVVFAGWLLTACDQAPAVTSEPGLVAKGRIALTATRAPLARGFRLQTLRSRNDEAALLAGEIHVFLRRLGDPPPGSLLAVLPGSRRDLTLYRLQKDQTYEALLRASKPDPEQPGGLLPMSDDASSTVRFDTLPSGGSYATTREVTFQLKLSDQVFLGIASGTAHITQGEIDDTLEFETLATFFPRL